MKDIKKRCNTCGYLVEDCDCDPAMRAWCGVRDETESERDHRLYIKMEKEAIERENKAVEKFLKKWRKENEHA